MKLNRTCAAVRLGFVFRGPRLAVLKLHGPPERTHARAGAS